MIVVEKSGESLFKTYSDSGLMIRQILDRLGGDVDGSALYEEADDIDVNGKPRFEYEETDIAVDEQSTGITEE